MCPILIIRRGTVKIIDMIKRISSFLCAGISDFAFFPAILYPAFFMADTISLSFMFLSSKLTYSFSAAKLTLALSTPLSLFRVLSIRPAQAEHVMPVI